MSASHSRGTETCLASLCLWSVKEGLRRALCPGRGGAGMGPSTAACVAVLKFICHGTGMDQRCPKPIRASTTRDSLHQGRQVTTSVLPSWKHGVYGGSVAPPWWAAYLVSHSVMASVFTFTFLHSLFPPSLPLPTPAEHSADFPLAWRTNGPIQGHPPELSL